MSSFHKQLGLFLPAAALLCTDIATRSWIPDLAAETGRSVINRDNVCYCICINVFASHPAACRSYRVRAYFLSYPLGKILNLSDSIWLNKTLNSCFLFIFVQTESFLRLTCLNQAPGSYSFPSVLPLLIIFLIHFFHLCPPFLYSYFTPPFVFQLFRNSVSPPLSFCINISYLLYFPSFV